MLLEVRVLHRFISWQLRIRFRIISSLLLDDSENKENQTLISFTPSRKKTAKGQFHPNLFSMAERQKTFYNFQFSLSIDSEMVTVAIQMPVHLR